MLSHVQLFETLWTIQSMEFCRPEYWSIPSPVDLPTQGSNPGLLHTGRFFTSLATREAQIYEYV